MNLVPRGAEQQQQQQCDKLLKRQLKLSVSTRRNKIPMKSKESTAVHREYLGCCTPLLDSFLFFYFF
jgi:hypothetical protein